MNTKSELVRRSHKTQDQIASEAGISKAYISLVLAGRRMPRLDRAGLIARALGISLDKLYETLCANQGKNPRRPRPVQNRPTKPTNSGP